MAPSGHGFNATNRGVYVADNLSFLRALNDECIDLVCIDPPFAKNDTFVADKLKPPLSHEEREIESRLLARWNIANQEQAGAAGIVWPDGDAKGGYRDIWSWENDVHEDWLASIDRDYESISRLIDTTRYSHGDSVAAYLCYMAIRIIEVHRVLKSTGSLYLHCDHTANAYLRQLLDGVFGKLQFRNEIIWSYRTGGLSKRYWPRKHDTIMMYVKSPQYKHNPQKERIYYEKPFFNQQTDEQGRIYSDVHIRDVWDDIKPLINVSNERTGYPTQKPVALAERIIQASTNPGDIVLDCFAGCAYAGVAAERLGRQWLACDFNPRAWTVLKRQFNNPELALLRCNDETIGQQVLGNEPVATVHGPSELPVRTSPVSEVEPQNLQPAERKFKVPASLIPEREMLEELLKLSGYKAWCCGYANRMPDGTIVETTRNFHLDHIDPKSKDGSNDIQNRAPLCPHHNIRKNNRRVHLSDYRAEIAGAGEMLVNSADELINLPYALQQAMQIYGQAYSRKNPSGT